MKLLATIINFVTSSFSGFATQLFFKKSEDTTKSQVKVRNSSKTQVRKNRVSGDIEILNSEDTTIENNEIIK